MFKPLILCSFIMQPEQTNTVDSRTHFFFKEILFFIYKLIYFILFIFGCIGCCAWAFSSCGERGLLFVAVHGLLIAVASLVAEHGL